VPEPRAIGCGSRWRSPIRRQVSVRFLDLRGSVARISVAMCPCCRRGRCRDWFRNRARNRAPGCKAPGRLFAIPMPTLKRDLPSELLDAVRAVEVRPTIAGGR
jgi:hypothetical protein